MKILDLNKSIHDICSEYPDVIGIMKELGFENITEPGMLNTAGRIMTISKGASMKKIPMDKIKDIFKSYGYDIKE